MKRLSTRALAALAVVPLLTASPARAFDVGEEAEITAAAVTALSCAQAVAKSGHFEDLGNCPMSEATKGLVILDVAERQIYRLSPKKVRFSELEKAFGGGSIDVTGTVVKVVGDIPELEVTEYSITPKPKPGAFKGCL